jgi:hypothetical protein
VSGRESKPRGTSEQAVLLRLLLASYVSVVLCACSDNFARETPLRSDDDLLMLVFLMHKKKDEC